MILFSPLQLHRVRYLLIWLATIDWRLNRNETRIRYKIFWFFFDSHKTSKNICNDNTFREYWYRDHLETLIRIGYSDSFITIVCDRVVESADCYHDSSRTRSKELASSKVISSAAAARKLFLLAACFTDSMLKSKLVKLIVMTISLSARRRNVRWNCRKSISDDNRRLWPAIVWKWSVSAVFFRLNGVPLGTDDGEHLHKSNESDFFLKKTYQIVSRCMNRKSNPSRYSELIYSRASSKFKLVCQVCLR